LSNVSGDDLGLIDPTNKEELRMLKIEGTYDSILGTDLPIVGRIKFVVNNLTNIYSD